MANCRVPGAPTIVLVIPGNGMVDPHFATAIGLLINGHQHMHRIGWIGGEVVPLIDAHPLIRQRGGRRMIMIEYMNGSLLNAGMIVEEGPYQLAIPRPFVLGIAGRMHTRVAATSLNIALKRRLL